MVRYEREKDYYERAASVCKHMCETALEQAGIKAIVTFRAKAYDKLQKKVEQRNVKRIKEQNEGYKTIQDIYDDIPDLAGVRVALYFPGDKNELDKLIHDRFDVLKRIEDFPPPISSYNRRFPGYSARHYRVHLKEDTLSKGQKHYSKALIEIQVATVLMHAWSEVEHDLGYKPTVGELSEDEYAILDEINGMVLAGEIALERLQRAIKRRVEQGGVPFKSQYELAIYLYSQLQLGMPINTPQVERMDLLFRLLQAAKLDHPGELMHFVSGLDLSETHRTISGQLIDSVLAVRPDLYEIYWQFLPEESLREELRLSSLQGVRTFLSRWATLEAIVNKIAEAKGQQAYMSIRAEVLQSLGLFTALDKEKLEHLDYYQKLRNRFVHKSEPPTLMLGMAAGSAAYNLTNDILGALGAQATEDTRKVIDSSEEIQKLLKSLKAISDEQAKKVISVVDEFKNSDFVRRSLFRSFAARGYSDILARDYERVLEFLEDLKDAFEEISK